MRWVAVFSGCQGVRRICDLGGIVRFAADPTAFRGQRKGEAGHAMKASGDAASRSRNTAQFPLYTRTRGCQGLLPHGYRSWVELCPPCRAPPGPAIPDVANGQPIGCIAADGGSVRSTKFVRLEQT